MQQIYRFKVFYGFGGAVLLRIVLKKGHFFSYILETVLLQNNRRLK